MGVSLKDLSSSIWMWYREDGGKDSKWAVPKVMKSQPSPLIQKSCSLYSDGTSAPAGCWRHPYIGRDVQLKVKQTEHGNFEKRCLARRGGDSLTLILEDSARTHSVGVPDGI